jgi:nicotinamide-nucleotide amidase
MASGEPAVLRSRVLCTWGYGESQVADELDDLYASPNPSVAYLVSGPEVRIRISAKAGDAATADKMIAAVEDEVLRRLGPVVFGRDTDTVEAILARELRQRGWRLATAEAATLGTVATTFAAADGAGAAFAGGLTVPPEAVDAGTDLERRALRLLDRAGAVLDGDVLVGVSEAYGDDPGPRATQSLAVAVHTPEHTRTRLVSLLGDTTRVRDYACGTVLHLARLAVTGKWWRQRA